MNALVLGGTQFVGRALARELVARGHEVTLLTRGRLPVDYAGVRRHVRADRRDATGLAPLSSERFDAVFDVSAYTADDVRPVLDALRLDEGSSYVLVSSGAVYAPSDEPLAEDAPRGESAVWGSYGAGKLEAENLLIGEQRRCGFSLSIVRPAYIYGPGNNLYREAYLFDRLVQGGVVPMPEGGACTQFAFIEDVVDQLIAMAQRAGGGAEAFNCAHPDLVDWRTLVEAAAAAVGVEPRCKEVAHRGRLEARSFFPFRDCTYLLEVGKAEAFGLGVPKTSLLDGMRQSFDWYRAACPAIADAKMTRIEEALAL